MHAWQRWQRARCKLCTLRSALNTAVITQQTVSEMRVCVHQNIGKHQQVLYHGVHDGACACCTMAHICVRDWYARIVHGGTCARAVKIDMPFLHRESTVSQLGRYNLCIHFIIQTEMNKREEKLCML